MGVSIYYICERNTSMSAEEQQQVNAIVAKYNGHFELKESGETFCVYCYLSFPDRKPPPQKGVKKGTFTNLNADNG